MVVVERYVNPTLIQNTAASWKTQARMTLAAKADLTPENNLLLTPEEFWPTGSVLFWLICL